MSPDYLGGDDVLRMAFVGLASNPGTETGGIFRFNDTTKKELTSDQARAFNSVAYDGARLAAGLYDSNRVYRSSDPLASSPTLSASRTYKGVGVDDTTANDMTVVAYNGETLLATKRGLSAGMYSSDDGGATFNGISLLDGGQTTIGDWYITPGGIKYFSAQDTQVSGIYRKDKAWERIFTSDDGTANYIIRGAPDNDDVVYFAKQGSTAMYYSTDGGLDRWNGRTTPGNVTDFCVESSDVIYIASGGSVRKSTHAGFTWGAPKTPELGSGNVATITSVGEGNVLVGSDAGDVSYSTDGGSTWTDIPGPAPVTGNVQAVATGFGEGDYLYVASGTDSEINRRELGVPGVEWIDITPTGAIAPGAGEGAYGMQLVNGTLYVNTSDGTDSNIYRTMGPSKTRVSWDQIAGTGYVTTQTPQSLETSPGSTFIWIIDILGNPPANADAVKYWEDTLVDGAVSVTGPATETLVSMNAITGLPNNVTLTWSRVSMATAYDVQVAQDEKFVEKVIDERDFGSSTPSQVLILGPNVSGSNAVSVTLTPGKTYYWRVRAAQPVTGIYSEVRSFTIQPGGAEVPQIASPSNGATITNQSPAFSWSPVNGATKYEFQLSTNPSFGTTVLTDTPTTAGALVPVTIKLEQGKQYFWRVRAIEPVEGDWSTAANFMVAMPEETTEPTPQVTVTQAPVPTFTIPPAQPAPTYTLTPPETKEIAPTYIWAIIIIGAILVIAVIVLIVRTRRSV
jgi:hypothetical protein